MKKSGMRRRSSRQLGRTRASSAPTTSSTTQSTLQHFLRRSPNPASLHCRCLESPYQDLPHPNMEATMAHLQQLILSAASRIFHPSTYGTSFEIVFELTQVRRDHFSDFCTYGAENPGKQHSTSYGPRYMLYRCELVGTHRQSRYSWSSSSTAYAESTSSSAVDEYLKMSFLRPSSGGYGGHQTLSLLDDSEDDAATSLIVEDGSQSPVSDIPDTTILARSETANSRILALQSVWRLVKAAEMEFLEFAASHPSAGMPTLQMQDNAYLPLQWTYFPKYQDVCTACKLSRPPPSPV